MGSVWLASSARRPLRRPGRRQAAEPRAGRPYRRRTLQARRHHPGPPHASEHRPADRRRRLGHRTTVPRAGACRRAGTSTGTATIARSSVGDRIRLFLDVLSAVAHAHANLIVHRDLKPSNVLVIDRRTGQAPGLRHRQAARARSRRVPRSTLTRERRRADAEVRRARAGQRRSDHHRDRCLRARRPALRAAERTRSRRHRRAVGRRHGAGDRRHRAAPDVRRGGRRWRRSTGAG